MTENHETHLGLQDNTEVLHRISARLGERFTGIFAAETVERYVFESYTALAREIRDQIHDRVKTLVASLTVASLTKEPTHS